MLVLIGERQEMEEGKKKKSKHAHTHMQKSLCKSADEEGIKIKKSGLSLS